MRFRTAALVFLAALLAPAASAQSLTAKNYAEIRKQIDLQPGDLDWQQISWKSTFLDGLIEAQKADKPIFLWLYFGDPRGSC